jgi:hypothetical protein
LVLVSAAFVLLYLACNLPAGEAYARGHDYLAQPFAFYVLRAALDGFFFDLNLTVPQLINGLPFNALALSDLSIGPNLYLIFEPGTAYVVNELLRRGLALVGTYLLLKAYVLPVGRHNEWIAALVALSYACIPDQSSRFATITMLPLLSYAMLNIWSGRRSWWNWMVILTYPFYSSLYFGGFVICGYLLIAVVVAFAQRRDDRWTIFGIFLALCTLYLLVEVRSIYMWLAADFESIRNYYPYSPPNFSRFWSTFANDFLFARNANHPTEHMPIILPLVMVVLVGIMLRRLKHAVASTRDAPESICRIEGLLVILFGLILLNTTVNSLDNGGYFNLKYEIGFPFSLHRLDVTSPPIWRVLLALAMSWLFLQLPKRFHLVPAGLLVLITFHGVLQLPGVKGEIREALNMPWYLGFRDALAGRDPGPPTGAYKPFTVKLNEYFLDSAFGEFGETLERRLGDKASYRVLSVDMSPTVAQYHGYYTLDGYYYDYPQEYEFVFNRFHAAEFAKEGVPLRRGHLRLYLYVSDLNGGDTGIDPDFDTCAFADEGGRVIFSLRPFSLPGRLGLEELGRYPDVDDVYVYVLDPARCYRPVLAEEYERQLTPPR